jgi:outer membrane protein OmpA-like peptidoglycan-associated protein
MLFYKIFWQKEENLKSKKIATSLVATSVLLTFTGCATNTGPGEPSSFNQNSGKIFGTLIGTAGGAILGKKMGGKNGMLLGAAIGGGLGYLIGNEIDKRQENIRKIAKKEHANISFDDIKNENGEKVGQSFVIHSPESQFNSGSFILNQSAVPMFSAIAKEYANSGQKVLIIGHTDADGSDAYNQKLSENRAQTIARLFRDNGVKEENIYYKGSGEFEPIATNKDLKGKALNRRVEVVEASSELVMAQYASNKTVNAAYIPKQEKSITQNNASMQKPLETQMPSQNNQNSAGQIDQFGNSVASSGKGSSLPAFDMPGFNMGNLKAGMPTLCGTGTPKFANIDMGGSTRVSGVSGSYYNAVKKDEEKLGSCNNEYAYSKKSVLEITSGQKEKEHNNLLLASVGEPVKSSTFSLVTPAVADDDTPAYYGSCLYDAVRQEGEIKKLSTGEPILAKENYKLAPLLNGTTWGAVVDNEFIMISPVGVSRNMKSVSCPELNIIKKGSNQPWYGTSTRSLSYNGEDGLLYRIYPQDKSKVQCIDLAYPHENPQNAEGVIYYKNSDGATYYKKVKFMAANK